MEKVSKAEVVREYIEDEIRAGRIRSGRRLPSCREVALLLSVNKLTVNRVYTEMEREHKVYSIPRGGFYLVEWDEEQKVEKAEGWDFKTIRPESRLLPYREFSHVINRAVDLYRKSLFGYGGPAGLLSLRDTLSGMFAREGVYADADRIVVTSGAQQAICLILQAVFRDGSGKLLVEAPTYNLALGLAESMGIAVEGIERRREGLDFRKMEALFRRGDIRAFYVIPRHHNPTGYTLSELDKRRCAELAEKYKVLIIEDDYLADIGSRKGVLPIHYYSKSKETAYIRSFSKAFMPGIRLGAAVLHSPLLEEVTELKSLSDLNTSLLSQAALALYIQAGMYEKHVNKVKKTCDAKLKRAEETFQALSPQELCWHVPCNGIFIWLQLPEGISATRLERILAKEGILVQTAGEFYPQAWPGRERGIRLCISGVPREGIDNLAAIIKKASGIISG